MANFSFLKTVLNIVGKSTRKEKGFMQPPPGLRTDIPGGFSKTLQEKRENGNKGLGMGAAGQDHPEKGLRRGQQRPVRSLPGNGLHPTRPSWGSRYCWPHNPGEAHGPLWAGCQSEWPENYWCSTFKREEERLVTRSPTESFQEHSSLEHFTWKAREWYCFKPGEKKFSDSKKTRNGSNAK